MRRDRKSSTHIKEVINNILTGAVPINLDDIGIWKIWDGVVGKRIAKHARPSWIKKGALMVKVTDSVWLQELEFKAETIKEKLNSKLQRQAIKRIQFRVGEPQDSKQIEERVSRQEDRTDLTSEKQGKMEEILARIKDKELRSSIRKVIAAAKKKPRIPSH